ncbi:MAG TPA: urease accessory UreF family protein, partial [Chloroflexota bacterium]|nr:urease accessory UreF family protein [Chloroflexota bacterium]
MAERVRFEPGELAATVADFLLGVVAPGDATALAAGWNATESDDVTELVSIDAFLTATKLTETARTTSSRCGRQLLSLTRSLPARAARQPAMLESLARLVRRGDADANHAVVFGAVACLWSIERRPAVQGYLHAAALSALSACMRLGAIDHVEVQRSLIQLETVVENAAMTAQSTSWSEMHGAAPYLEMMTMK